MGICIPIDPIGYGKMSICTPKHLIKEFASRKKMMNWSKLIGQYVPLKTGWPLENEGRELLDGDETSRKFPSSR